MPGSNGKGHMKKNPEEYWTEAAEKYKQTAYKKQARYPFYEVRLDLVRDLLKDRSQGTLLDAGCGGGNVLLDFLKLGWDGYGCDLVEPMVDLARENLSTAGFESDRIKKASVADLSAYPDQRFDVILSLGVMEYLRPEEEVSVFAEARRVLRDDGLFVVENINNLFDLVTFNKFTMAFFEQHFWPQFFPGEDDLHYVAEKTRALLTHPDEPKPKSQFGTTRDEVYTKAENPLTYPQKAGRLGFRVVEQAFYRFHAVPPLLFKESPDLEKVTISHELELSRHWVGHFLASGFVSVLKKG